MTIAVLLARAAWRQQGHASKSEFCCSVQGYKCSARMNQFNYHQTLYYLCCEKLRFVGYSQKSKGYHLFNEETRHLSTRRDVILNETDFNSHRNESEVIESKEVMIARTIRLTRTKMKNLFAQKDRDSLLSDLVMKNMQM